MSRKSIVVFVIIIFFVGFPYFIAKSSQGNSSMVEENLVISEIESAKKKESMIEALHFDLKRSVIDSVFDRRAKKNAFNGVVLASQKGLILYEKAFGYANYAHKEKMEADHVFQLASVSKQFTAAAIMLLKQREMLTYDDTVQQYIPDFPYEGITIRHLLTHRSGLPNYIYKAEEYFSKDYFHDSTLTNNQILEMLTNEPPAKYGQPDGRFKYSNTGYIVLASIVEKISGVSFDVFLKEEIFEPAGMHNAFARSVNTPQEKLSHVVQGYTARKQIHNPYFLDTVLGDKSVYATAHDMFMWHVALSEGKIIRKDILEEAFEKGSPKKRGKYNYGFGYRLFECSDGSQVVYHTGWWKGFSTLFIHYPETESCLVILTNRTNRAYYNINAVLDTLAIPEYHRI